MSLNEGDKLGRFEIQTLLGAGGMGEVYRARDTQLDRTVAIKVLPECAAGREDLRERLAREAKAVSSLNHPNICALYDVGCDQGVDYLVMEYLEGVGDLPRQRRSRPGGAGLATGPGHRAR